MKQRKGLRDKVRKLMDEGKTIIQISKQLRIQYQNAAYYVNAIRKEVVKTETVLNSNCHKPWWKRLFNIK